jgi:copper chaperone CopZ
MIKLKVTGMTCEHCERAVSAALSAVPGVEKVISVSGASNEAMVEGSANAEALWVAVREEGYEAEVAQ